MGSVKLMSVEELQRHLFTHLRELRAGETILITDCGQVVAELRVHAHDVGATDECDLGMERPIDIETQSPGHPNDPVSYRRSPVNFPSLTIDRMLDESRGER